MGSQFSMGMFPELLVPLTAMDLESIRRAYTKFTRHCNTEHENDGFFMTRRNFQMLFVDSTEPGDDKPADDAVSDASYAFRLFSFFDPQQTGTVVAIDIWGALILASAAKEENKLKFLFMCADLNNDKFINETELSMVMHSASRGFSRMKKIEAPSTAKIEQISKACMDNPEVRLDDRGEISLPDIILMASANDNFRNYMSNLDSSAGADVSNLYKQQASYLRELAMIDSVLDTMERHDRDMTIDEKLYQEERGGDVADIVYEGLFEDPSDVARLYLSDLLAAADYDKERQNTLDEQNKKNRLGETSTFDDEIPLTLSEMKFKEKDRSEFMREASQQATRRAVRKRRMRAEEEKESGRFGDAAAFRIGYKRVQAQKSSRHGESDSSAEDIIALNQMEAKWKTMKHRNNDDLQKLDIDLFEDLVEATGNLIHDREAKSGLDSLPASQLGMHALASVQNWWKKRQQDARRPPTPPWRRRMASVLDTITAPWNFFDKVKYEADRQVQINKVEESWTPWKTEEDLARETEIEDERVATAMAEERRASQLGLPPPTNTPPVATPSDGNAPPAIISSSNNFAPDSKTTVKAWESDSDSDDDDERNSKIGCRLFVGHQLTEKEKASIKINVASSGLQGVLGGGGATPGSPSKAAGGTSRPGTRPGSTGGARPATAASHIGLFGKELLETVFRTASPEFIAQNAPFAEAGGFGSVLWIDFPIEELASEDLVAKMVKQVEYLLEAVPRDYAKPLYVASRVSVAPLTARDARRFLRIELYSDRDPFVELEKMLPPKTVLKDIVDHLSLNLLFNVSLDELLELTKQFVNLEHKCYGPQEEELGEKGMDPAVFMNSVKQRRKAALRAAKSAGNKGLSLKEMKEILKSRGYGVGGTIAEIKDRVEQLFTLQAEVCGYGELSNFGEGCADALFKRFDRDNDGALNFFEMNALQRAFGGIALEYPGKYEAAMRDSGFATNEKGWANREGVVAYYERFGRLADDVSDLGLGSIDDYVCCAIDLLGEVKSKVVEGVDRLFDLAREANFGLKKLSFVSRFMKDFYLDYECKRISDLFLKEECPSFLLEPGGPALLLRKLKSTLANGRRGYIPEIREGVGLKLGPGWGWSQADEWTIYSPEEEEEQKVKKEQAECQRIAQAGIDKGIKVEEYNIGTTEGWREFTLADGSRPRWLKDVLDSIDDEKARNETQKSSDDVKFAEAAFVPLGTTEKIAQLKSELEGLQAALSKALPRRQREELGEMEAERRAEMKKQEEILERGVNVSSHQFCRAYDAMRKICQGVHSVNWGNHAFTVRSEFEGFEFFHHLPAGMHEEDQIIQEKDAKLRRAIKRKEEAKVFIEKEREKKLMEATDRARMKAEYEASKDAARAEEEATLYSRGSDARVRGYAKVSDQKLCIDMWRRLYLLFENRYDQINQQRDVMAVSIAANNLGVVCFEFGDGQMNMVREARMRLTKADQYVDDTLKMYKVRSLERAMIKLRDEQRELQKIADLKMKEKIAQEMQAKGQAQFGGGGGSSRKSKLLQDASKEAQNAANAADEARRMEAELMAEFASSGEEEGSSSSSSDEERRDSDDEFGESSIEGGGEEEEKKKGEGKNKKEPQHSIFSRRRSSMVKPELKGKVEIPENIALAAAIVKFNLVTMMNEMGDPVDAEDNDERQHLMYDSYNLYRDFVGEEIKGKLPVGDTINVKNIGVARVDDFPPEDWEEWGVRTTQADLDKMAAEQKEKQQVEGHARAERKRIRAVRRAKKEAHKAKKNKKLMREFKIQEHDALTAEGGIDMATLEIINPKKAAKIRDRLERMDETANRRLMIDQQREQRKIDEEARKQAKLDEHRLFLAKKELMEEEIAEILEEDRVQRSGLGGILNGMRWKEKPDVEKLRQEIEDRELADRVAKKKKQKDKKKAEKERANKLADEEAKRVAKAIAKEAGEYSSSSDSDASKKSDTSDLTFEGGEEGEEGGKKKKKGGRLSMFGGGGGSPTGMTMNMPKMTISPSKMPFGFGKKG